MADNEKNNFSEEEYQLPEDEYVPPEEGIGSENAFQGEEPTEKQGGMKALLDKGLSYLPKSHYGRISMVVGIIVVFAIIVHFASSDNDTIPLVKKPVVQQVAQQPVSQPVIQPVNPNINSINALQASSSQVTTEIQNLRSQVDDMNSAMAQSQSTISSLKKTVSDLTDQVSMLNAKLNQVVARFSSSKRFGPEIVYHLRAILPDRAWLVSNTGGTLSVTIGDKIDQYGVVQSINAQQGVIITSSGRKIYYGDNDF